MSSTEKIQKAIETLQQYNAWRKYGAIDRPDHNDINDALETAISTLKSLINKPEKEYYGG